MNRKHPTGSLKNITLRVDPVSEQEKLGDLVTCARLNMRRCAHLLNKRVVPLGAQQDVARGNHRVFSPAQAFHLVLAHRLSELRVPVGHIRALVHGFYRHYNRVKQGAADDFFPPKGSFDHRFDWQLVVARGEWMVTVPKEYVAGWLLGGKSRWYSVQRRRIEQPDRDALELCWLVVPLVPITECVAPIPIPLTLDIPPIEP